VRGQATRCACLNTPLLQLVQLDPISTIITVTPVYTILVESCTQFAEYVPGKGIIKREGWGPTSGQTLWIAEDTSAAQTLMTWTPLGNKKSTEWTESHILDRVLLRDSGSWTDTNRDAVLEQGYEASVLAPQACCPRCTHKKATIISGVRERRNSHTIPAQEQDRTSQERYLDCFCPQRWSFQNFRHNMHEVRNWSFLAKALKECTIKDPKLLKKGFKGPIKDSEMQKIADHNLKNKSQDRTPSRLSSSKRCHRNN
jgi:hypothetical protein